jgi:branched-chain amino acid transport system ATP-binding protein
MLVRFNDVSRSFGAFDVLRNVTFEIRAGAKAGLIGPNGSGKTTLLNLISGVYLPDRGRIVYAGHDITSMPTYGISRLGLSRTFQNINLAGDMSALDNAGEALGAAGVATAFTPAAGGWPIRKG